MRSTLENMIYITLRPGTSGGVTKFLAMKQGERERATLPREGLESIEWAKKTG